MLEATPYVRFNPETDPDRPAVGSVITYKQFRQGKRPSRRRYRIAKVAYIPADELMFGPDLDHEGHDKILLKMHTTRIMVAWTLWCDRVKKVED